MSPDHYVVPKNYTEQLERKKIRSLYDILSEAASRVQGPCVVVSTSITSDQICLWNAPMREPTRKDLERRAFLSKDELPIYLAALAFFTEHADAQDKIILQESFSCPARQLPSLIHHIRAAATYQGFLPFYASVFLEARPSFN